MPVGTTTKRAKQFLKKPSGIFPKKLGWKNRDGLRQGRKLICQRRRVEKLGVYVKVNAA
ncbi:hypothetical protein [Bradyrhizobium sp.]|jgi:hypothetical protein|uniref:hypothetical protein n=1 Tax=Bradyrhizobium sp. TaxID=376 RepID=UPI003C2A84DB